MNILSPNLNAASSVAASSHQAQTAVPPIGETPWNFSAGAELSRFGRCVLTETERSSSMNRPSPLLSVAVVISALSPAAILALQIWGGETWPGLLKREVISSTNIERAPPLSIPMWHASRIKLASAEPQYNFAMLSVRFKAAFCRAVE